MLDTESAYSAMDKNPATVDETLDLVKRALHNWKALFGAQAKTIRNVSFMEENEGVEERHIHVVKASQYQHLLRKRFTNSRNQWLKPRVNLIKFCHCWRGGPHGQAFQNLEYHLDAINAMKLVIL